MFGPKGGRQDRPLAGRPPPRRVQAPRDLRGEGNPLGRDADRRESQRHHRAAPLGRSRPADRPPWQFRPKTLLADRAYDSKKHRKALRERGITPRIAKRGTGHGSGLGKERWIVERTISWLHANRRLDRRYDRRNDIHEAFLIIGCALICHKHPQHSFC
jgi:transposase